MAALYAVIGNPISHSKSPIIHAQFAKQTQQDLFYTAINAPINDFAQTLKKFFAEGGQGCNITLPFKQDAWAIVDTRSTRAEMAGAVNTIKIEENGNLFGDNTDGVGLVRDITLNQHYSLQNRTILLLGAGGAVRGVLKPLLDEKPAKVVVANRTVEKARELAMIFSQSGCVKACGLEELEGQQFDLIINGTSASIKEQTIQLPNHLLTQGGFCYDMMYAKEPTTFLQWAKLQQASHCIDGLGMLVEQAAESFYIWRGIRPDTQPVLMMLRS